MLVMSFHGFLKIFYAHNQKHDIECFQIFNADMMFFVKVFEANKGPAVGIELEDILKLGQFDLHKVGVHKIMLK